MNNEPTSKHQSIVEVGGNIDDALTGQYTINPIAVVKEAWKLTLLSRYSINIGLLFVFILGIISSTLLSHYLGGIEQVLANPQARLVMNIVVTVIIWPFLAGVEMMGVLHAVGLKSHAKLVFSFLRRGSWVALCAVMTSIFISLGIQFFILPGIFLAVALSLTIPLVVEKRLSPGKAIILSVKALRFQWFNIFSAYLILIGALFVSLLPLFLLKNTDMVMLGGVIFFVLFSYIAPWYFNIKGVLYREIFGMKLHKLDSNDQIDHDTFIA